jgi:hypothetical protein
VLTDRQRQVADIWDFNFMKTISYFNESHHVECNREIPGDSACTLNDEWDPVLQIYNQEIAMTKNTENSTEKQPVTNLTSDAEQGAVDAGHKKPADVLADDKQLAQSGRKGGLTSDDTAFA